MRKTVMKEGRPDVDVDGGTGLSEAHRYARAVLAGIVIAFVMLVAAPQTPPTYLLAMGLFAVAVVLLWVND